MARIRAFIKSLARDKRGQDYIEYALMAGFAVTCAVSCLRGQLAVGLRFGDVMHTLTQTLVRIVG